MVPALAGPWPGGPPEAGAAQIVRTQGHAAVELITGDAADRLRRALHPARGGRIELRDVQDAERHAVRAAAMRE